MEIIWKRKNNKYFIFSFFVFEEFKESPEKNIKEAYNFLGADTEFKPHNISKKVNKSRVPRFSGFHKKVVSLSRKMHQYNLSFLVDYALKLNLNELFYKGKEEEAEFPELDEQSEQELKKYYGERINQLSKLLNKNLSYWKNYEKG